MDSERDLSAHFYFGGRGGDGEIPQRLANFDDYCEQCVNSKIFPLSF